MLEYPKLYIGPMSKSIVDCVCALEGHKIGLIPSRRQVEFDGGYVNNWSTKSFSNYVKSKNTNVIIQRDHGGPDQGAHPDNGLESFKQTFILYGAFFTQI